MATQSKSSYFGPHLVFALQNQVFKVANLDRNILKIVKHLLEIVFILFRLYTCETRIIILIINNPVLKKIKIAVESDVKNWAYISLR